MEINSKNIVLNLLGEANIQINKKLLLTLGLEEAFFLSYLIDQYRFFEREGKLREDGSFYTTNMSISLYTTLNDSQIIKLKKKGTEKSLFKYKLEDSRTKTFYYLNFDKILELIGTNKSNLELAYKSVFNDENVNFEINNLEDIENIQKLTVKELRFYCKKNNISYSGNDRKNILIGKILENNNPYLFSISHFCKVDENTTTSEREIRPPRKNDALKESVNENTSTVDEIFVTNQEHNNQEQISCHERDIDIENLFHKLGVNFTNSNVHSTNIILKKLNNDKNLLLEYIKLLFDNLSKTNYKVNNFSALFSSKLKVPDENLIKNLLKKRESILRKIESKEFTEKLKIVEEEKEKVIIKQNENVNLIMETLNNLDINKKDKILEVAIIETLKTNPEFKDILDLKKYNFGIIQCRLLLKNLKKILKEENIL